VSIEKVVEWVASGCALVFECRCCHIWMVLMQSYAGLGFAANWFFRSAAVRPEISTRSSVAFEVTASVGWMPFVRLLTFCLARPNAAACCGL
jgi:hypothetical protein